jgi:arabinogalactan oligomer/maltooligosaccharide transport system permease protein
MDEAKPRGLRGFLIEGLIHLVLIAAVAFALYPILWVIAAALSPGDAPDLGAMPIPRELSLEHVDELTTTTNDEGTWLFGIQLANSLLVSAATAIVAILIATPAAYALARFDFVGARGSTRALLATQMFPGVAASIPLYMLLHYLHLLDSRTGLILVYSTTSVPFAIFQLRSAFEGIPRDLEEAAMVDGATRAGAFVRVVLPAARPALAVTALFAFMSAWNEFILAATFMTSEEHYTLPIVLQRYVGEYDVQLGTFAAGAILVSVPVMLLFYALQRHLVAGLTSGGVKG